MVLRFDLYRRLLKPGVLLDRVYKVIRTGFGHSSVLLDVARNLSLGCLGSLLEDCFPSLFGDSHNLRLQIIGKSYDG